jgi:hypothetical protein
VLAWYVEFFNAGPLILGSGTTRRYHLGHLHAGQHDRQFGMDGISLTGKQKMVLTVVNLVIVGIGACLVRRIFQCWAIDNVTNTT